jgi:hypothetical protein
MTSTPVFAKEASDVMPIAPADYNRILNGLQLTGIRQSHTQCDATDNSDVAKFAVKMQFDATLLSSRKEAVRVSARHRFQAFEGSPQNPAVTIEAEYTLDFRAAEDLPEVFFEVYRDLSLPTTTWPYFREFVQSSLGRMGLPPFTLPFVLRPGLGASSAPTTASRKPARRKSS